LNQQCNPTKSSTLIEFFLVRAKFWIQSSME
jgi:hypothetical protein